MLVLKSSSKLRQGLSGTDDIDVLLQGDDMLNSISPSNAYPLIYKERYDIFKIHNGRLLHFDAHKKYFLGPKFSKLIDYRELDLVLRENKFKRVKFTRFLDINVINKNEELKLFVARSILRSYRFVFQKKYLLSQDFSNEFSEQLNKECIGIFYGAYNQHVLLKNDNKSWYLSRRNAFQLRKKILSQSGISELKYFGFVASNYFKLFYYAFARKVAPFWVSKRGLDGGLVVAFVAPDGLGKSSLVNAIFEQFNHKFDCYKFYLGIGDGNGFKLRKFIQNKHADRFKQKEKSSSRGSTSHLIAIIRCTFAVTVALERYLKIKRIFRAKRHNALIFVDRWPHNQTRRGLDGPIKPPLVDNIVCRYFLMLEEKIFDRMRCYEPDLIFLLDATHDESARRKPGEISKADFDMKMNIAKSVFKHWSGYREIDAAKSFDVVCSAVMIQLRHFLIRR